MPDPPLSPFRIPLAGAVRRALDSAARAVVAPAYEHRTIVVAQGLEYNNDQVPQAEKVPEGVRRLLRWRGLDRHLDVETDGTAHYLSDRQRVRFTIRRVDTRSAFKRALETAGILVIYDGHARYGRGPCFGPDPGPGEQWGNGDAPASGDTGMWRIGFPFVGVPFSDILHHRYTARIATRGEVEASTDEGVLPRDRGKPPREDCHPHVQRAWRNLEALTLEEIASRLHLADPSGLRSRVQGAAADPGARYWTFLKWDEGRRKRYAVLHAGWSDTATTPMDLGGTELRCRCFCHFGCSTLTHNYPVLRRLSGWTRTETDRFAYWTTRSAWGPTTARWIYYLLTYRTRNAYLSWRPSLRSARARTNGWLARQGYTFRIR